MRKLSVTLVTAVTLTALTTPPAAALDDVGTTRLRNAVTVGGILAHQRVLQRIANQNDGIRASGTPGYTASAAYVARTLRASGYTVRQQTFTFPFWRDLGEPTLQQVSPTAADYATVTFQYSGSGTVTGQVVPTLDVQLPPGPTPNSSSSGCEPEDFPAADPTAPQIALVQRGSCTFAAKVANAQAAGYDAVVIFNEGQPGRQDLLQGSLGDGVTIPVLGLDFAAGAELATATGAGAVVLTVSASTEYDPARETTNVIADSPGGDPNKVVVVGAHLDSVIEGPGINDNGSGTAAILEIARQIQALKITPRQKLRFAFWGAEELGLLGSEHYVSTLPDNQLAKIVANLNFDMLGSPNYVRFVYDGDGSEGQAGPPGSGRIEQLFTDYFAGQGLATTPTAFDGRSDYGPFIAAGIPAGGLFSGAEGIKTPEEAAVYGGTAGEPYDACYHQACDDIGNLSTTALAELGDGAAHAVLTLARSKTGLYEDGSFRAASARTSATAARTATAAAGPDATAATGDHDGHALTR